MRYLTNERLLRMAATPIPFRRLDQSIPNSWRKSPEPTCDAQTSLRRHAKLDKLMHDHADAAALVERIMDDYLGDDR